MPRKRNDNTPSKGGPPPNWREQFLESMSRTFNATYSSKVAGVSKETAFRIRREDPEFAKQWERAFEEGRQRSLIALEQNFLQRAIHGYDEPIYHGAKQVGTKRVYNATREIFALKCHLPERYDLDRYRSSVPTESALEMGRRIRAAFAGGASVIDAAPTNGHHERVTEPLEGL